MRPCSFNTCTNEATVRPVLLFYAPRELDPTARHAARVLTSIVSCSECAQRIDVNYLGPKAVELVCDGMVAAGKARPDLARTRLELIPVDSAESIEFDQLTARGRA